MNKKIIIFGLLLVFILSAGLGCKKVDKQTEAAMKPITINYWRVFDDSDAFREIIAKYQTIHPNVRINYRKLRYEEYENELLNALAEDRGPDILSIHNTWIRKYQNKLAPLPAQITMAFPVEKGPVKKEIIPELRTSKTLSLKDVKDKYLDVVYGDVVLDDNQIYALPLSVDTLVLYYNRDLFNNTGIIEAPKYWNKTFQQNVKKLTLQDSVEGIVQSGIAMGAADNIERFSDILSVLMMQNGSVMMDGSQVQFNVTPSATRGNNYNPGLEALRFYIDFSNPGKEVYAWNEELQNSLTLFTSGKVAMMFGYSYHLPIIKAQAPKLNFSISSLPQIENSPIEVNFANYWVEGVSKKSKNQAAAWDFILFMSKEEQIKGYLEKTKKPTALRSLIKWQQESDELSVFANQLLTAKSWYKGKDSNAAETALAEMVSAARQNPNKLIDALNTGAAKVQQTIK